MEVGACCSNVLEFRYVDISSPSCMVFLLFRWLSALVNNSLPLRFWTGCSSNCQNFIVLWVCNIGEENFCEELKVLASGCNPPSSNSNLSTIFLFGRDLVWKRFLFKRERDLSYISFVVCCYIWSAALILYKSTPVRNSKAFWRFNGAYWAV